MEGVRAEFLALPSTRVFARCQIINECEYTKLGHTQQVSNEEPRQERDHPHGWYRYSDLPQKEKEAKPWRNGLPGHPSKGWFVGSLVGAAGGRVADRRAAAAATTASWVPPQAPLAISAKAPSKDQETACLYPQRKLH